MSCDKESLAGTWINSNCRCSADMETRFITEVMQDWWITKTWEKEWNENDWNMGYEHVVWDNELRQLRGKNLKIGSRIVSFWQRTFESCYILTLSQTPASLKSFTPFSSGQSCWVPLYSGFVNPCCRWVACAGLFWSLLHVSVWSRWRWGMMNGLWTRH